MRTPVVARGLFCRCWRCAGMGYAALGTPEVQWPEAGGIGGLMVESARGQGETLLDAESTGSTRGLLEREAELASVETLISGDGRLLAIEGPPGIGKTSLIQETRRRARASGMRVFAARGSELERTYSFGVVRQLFEEFVVQMPEEDRGEILGGAAALAVPLFEPAKLEDEAARDPSLAMLHGLYWLTANASARAPLLIAIDDLHWCDPPSMRWLAYVLARLEGLDVVIVVGLRPRELGAQPALLGQILSDPQITVIRPAPLSSSAAAEYVRATLSPDADDGFCGACHEFTGGNPLLLRELLNAIVVENVEPFAANVPSLQELAGRAAGRTVTVRLSRLPSDATKLAQAVAILGDVDPYQAAALSELDEEAALRATDDLVRAEILRPQPPLGFVHPLVRGAVYQSLTPLQRNQGHARAATLLEDSGAESDRVAAQLLLVPPALVPSEEGGHVVALLREAARGARRRGATESAIAYLRRALAEPPADAERAELLLELGSAESLVDGVAAVEHYREAHGLLQDPIARGRAAFRIGRLLFFLRPAEAPAVLTQALDELGEADDELAGFLEAALIAFALFEKQLYPDALRRLERARSLPDEMTTPERWMLALLTYHDARTNVPAARVVEIARRVLASRPPLPGEPSPRPWVVTCQLLALADVDEAVTIFDSMLADARRHGGMLDVALAQLFRAETFIFRGDLSEAVAEALEARRTYEAWGTAPHFLALVAAYLADASMEQGKLDEAAAALARIDVASYDSTLLHASQLSSARLQMLTGDLAGGVEQTRDAGRRFAEVGGSNPAFLPWRSQAALALLELGEQDEARRLAGEELDLAQTWGAPRALGAALRAAGLAEGGSEGLAKLEQAVAVLEDSPAKLEHAKARTELGAALRRANRRSQAREHLSRGLELATICGATPLAARAGTRLLATGARPRRVSLGGLESLTPSERRVAEMAAKGPTNREIAQALFVTPKTVEVHLSSAYRKLHISSRSQLAAALDTAPCPE